MILLHPPFLPFLFFLFPFHTVYSLLLFSQPTPVMQGKDSWQAQPKLAVGGNPGQEGADGEGISQIYPQVHDSSSRLAIALEKAPVQLEQPFTRFLQ